MKKLKRISFQDAEKNGNKLNFTELMSILGGTLGTDCTFQCLVYAELQNGILPGQSGYKTAEDFENEYFAANPGERDSENYKKNGPEGTLLAPLVYKYFTTVSYRKNADGTRPLPQILDSINSSNIDVMLKIKGGSSGRQHAVMATGYHTTDPNDPSSLVYDYYDPQNKISGTVKIGDADPLFGIDDMKR